jgi:hypothetical protein
MLLLGEAWLGVHGLFLTPIFTGGMFHGKFHEYYIVCHRSIFDDLNRSARPDLIGTLRFLCPFCS